jgi:MSHA biogenesis protein MshM
MYLEHFGLNEFPFGITPDTEFFYSSQASQLALQKLLLAMQNGEGFVKVVGEVGTGKTMLCRKLMNSLDRHYQVAYIPNPYLKPKELLQEIATEFGARLSPYVEAQNLHQEIQSCLLDIYRSGKKAVLCLDEAQAMPIESMEALRLLTNFETEKSKLLQVVIFGQPELDIKLNSPSIRQLKQRITYSLQLQPLQVQELDEYVSHRLKVAGYGQKSLFTSKAFWLLKMKTGRIPRLVNILTHKAMLAAFQQHSTKVNWFHVWTAARETESVQKMQIPLKPLGLSLMAVCLGTFIWLWTDTLVPPTPLAVESPMALPQAPDSQPAAVTQPVDSSVAPKVDTATATRAPPSPTDQQIAQQFFQDALPLIRNGQINEAQSLLRQALQQHPLHHEARQLMVRTLIDAKQLTTAQSVLQEGIAKAPDKTEFWISLVHLQMQKNDTDAAMEILRKGLRFNQNNAPYLALNAAVLQSKGMHAEASDSYQAALKISPNNSQWLVGWGASLQALNKLSEAKGVYQRALDIGVSPGMKEKIQAQLAQINLP